MCWQRSRAPSQCAAVVLTRPQSRATACSSPGPTGMPGEQGAERNGARQDRTAPEHQTTLPFLQIQPQVDQASHRARDDQWKGLRLMIVSSRSGPVEMIVTGTPTSACRRSR